MDWTTVTASELSALLEANPQAVRRPNPAGDLPVFTACARAAADIVVLMLDQHCKEAGPGLRMLGRSGSILHCALGNTRAAEIVSLCLERDPGLAALGDRGSGRLPLHYAVRLPCADQVVPMLLEAHPAAVNVVDREMKLPLHWAAAAHSPQTTLLARLLAAGGPESATARDNYGKVALEDAQLEVLTPHVRWFRRRAFLLFLVGCRFRLLAGSPPPSGALEGVSLELRERARRRVLVFSSDVLVRIIGGFL